MGRLFSLEFLLTPATVGRTPKPGDEAFNDLPDRQRGIVGQHRGVGDQAKFSFGEGVKGQVEFRRLSGETATVSAAAAALGVAEEQVMKSLLYLAAGRYILASRVGEAALVLDDEMLVDYHGVVDPEYPARLAARIREVLADRTRLKRGEAGVAIARERFDYDVLARRLGERVRALGTSAA